MGLCVFYNVLQLHWSMHKMTFESLKNSIAINPWNQKWLYNLKITAKLNLMRIYEYKVFIHIKQNQVLNGEKDQTCQWFKKNLGDQMKRSEILSWRTLWRDSLKNMNATLVFMNSNRNFWWVSTSTVPCTGQTTSGTLCPTWGFVLRGTVIT